MENNALSLPHNIEAESAVLGSVIISPEMYYELEGLITADDFYIHRNRWVWEAFAELHKKKTPIDLLTLTDEIDRTAGRLAELGGAAYLTKLLNSSPSSINAPAYAKSVRDASIRRKLYEIAGKAIRHANDESVSASEALELVQRDLDDVQVGSSETDVEVFADVLRKYEEDRESGVSVSVFPTKTPDLNRILGGGLWTSRVCLLAGKKKLGKTLISWRIIQEIAEGGTPCAFISQEMSKRDLVARAVSAEGSIPEDLLLLGKIGGHEQKYDDALARLEKLPIYISQRSSWGMDALRAEIMRQRRENGVMVVLVDHVRLMEDNPNAPKAAAHEQLDYKTLGLKKLAKDADVAILAIYTLNTQGELSGGEAPQYNVDLALKLMSDEEYQKDPSNPVKGTPQINILWLKEEYRRYGRYESVVQLKKDDEFPVIRDALVPKGLR